MIFGKGRKNVRTGADPRPAFVPAPSPHSLRGVPTGRNIPRQRPQGNVFLSAPGQEAETSLQLPDAYTASEGVGAPTPQLPLAVAKEAVEQIRAEIGDIRKTLERAKSSLKDGAVPSDNALPVQVHLDDIEGYLCFIEYDLRCMLGNAES